jgi:hypothetical protein
MVDDHSLFPIAIVEDRYMGTYSKGQWLAIANADTLDADRLGQFSRVQFCLNGEGPNGDDIDAMIFWESPPEWIAAGSTPDEAVANLKAKAT